MNHWHFTVLTTRQDKRKSTGWDAVIYQILCGEDDPEPVYLDDVELQFDCRYGVYALHRFLSSSDDNSSDEFHIVPIICDSTPQS